MVLDMQDLILKLYSKQHTVFQIEEIAQMMPSASPGNLRRRLNYFVSVGKLKNPRRGIYAKIEYEVLELANKIFAPSYISLETVLQREGVVFQYYETIFVASYLSREITVDGQKIWYRQIGEPALSNRSGIEERNGYFIATKERAFLDAVFLYKNYYFDNLGPIDWKKVEKLKDIYGSKILEKRVKDYGKH